MRIKKTSQTATLPAQVVNTYSDSTEDTYSCDYINKTSEWKLVGETTGSTVITLPSEFNEIYIETEYKQSLTNTIIPKSLLTSSYKYYAGTGYYAGTTNNLTCTWRCNSSSVNLNVFILSGSELTNSATVRVYYR